MGKKPPKKRSTAITLETMLKHSIPLIKIREEIDSLARDLDDMVIRRVELGLDMTAIEMMCQWRGHYGGIIRHLDSLGVENVQKQKGKE